MTDIVERLRATDSVLDGDLPFEAADEIERLTRLLDAFHDGTEVRAEIERLRALLRRHQVAAWCEEDSDLAVETRRALEPKP